mgnify:CR=1 FL=1
MKSPYCFIGLVFLLTAGCQPSIPRSFIAVNVVGYEVGQPKQAFLANARAERFEILNVDNLNVVYTHLTGTPEAPDAATGDQITPIDFTSFNEPGTYKIRVNGREHITSASFNIERNVYGRGLNTILNSYYYHRCGARVANGTEWGYRQCHLHDAPFYANKAQYRDVTGGWHDAGDYNKFSVNTSLSAGLLLYAYDSNPEHYGDRQLNIPEAGNEIPDILDEAVWALNWLLKMQRPDGAVYHKVSQKKWIGEFLPHNDPSTRYLFETSSAATASFAAVSALAARLLTEYDPGRSEQLSAASRKAWKYLEDHPDDQPVGGFQNPPDVYGGEYGDRSDLDERIWASAELYKLTGQADYVHYFMQNYHKMNLEHRPPISWRDVQSLALHAFMSSDTKGKYAGHKKEIRETGIRHAESILAVRENNNYKNLITEDQYYWGSNSVGLAYAFELLQSYELTDRVKYRDAALDQLHYVLGRNPFGISQVTGIGSVSVQHPYHQLSEKDKVLPPVPGMLVGGPNSKRLLQEVLISDYPGKNYEDRFKNYLVNEPAVNYTAMLAYVVGAFAVPTSQTNNITHTNN